MIGQAQTGTGKTAAFGLPMIEYLDPALGEVQALVLTPTRELCIQVTQALRAYGRRARRSTSSPSSAARRSATRRRSCAPAARSSSAPSAASSTSSRAARWCSTTAASSCSTRPTRCSTSASSRTSSGSSRAHPSGARRRSSRRRCRRRDPRARRPLPLRPGDRPGRGGDAHDRHRRAVPAHRSRPRRRKRSSSRCCAPSSPSRRSSSCARRSAATGSSARSATRGIDVRALHGDMTQGARDGVMLAFKAARLPLLVATDVAARGLDISTVTHVINFDVPITPDIYVHRDRAHRPRRALRPRDHVRRAASAQGDGGDRAPHRHGRSPPGRAARHAPHPRYSDAPRRHEKPHVGRASDEPKERLHSSPVGATTGSTSRGSSPRSPARRGSTARRSPTSPCSSASRSERPCGASPSA